MNKKALKEINDYIESATMKSLRFYLTNIIKILSNFKEKEIMVSSEILKRNAERIKKRGI